MELSPKVAAAIDKFFAAHQRMAVTESLAQYGDATHEREAERIHLLSLKISRPDIERIRGLIQAAERDYRDLIAWATQSTRRYVVGLLRNGPAAIPGKFTSCSRSRSRSGSVMIPSSPEACRLATTTSAESTSLKLDSIEAAEALVAADPAIQSGHLRFEFHTWLAPAGLQVGIRTDYLDIDVH